MKLFGFGKKKDEEMVTCNCDNSGKGSDIEAQKATAENKKKVTSCCCGLDFAPETMATAETAKAQGPRIKILGGGCAKCNALEASTKEALEKLGMDSTIEHVSDFSQIAAYGVMTTPALVVDGKVVSFGKVLKTDEVVKVLQKLRG